MAELNPVVEDPSAEQSGTGQRSSKARVSVPRNLIPAGGGSSSVARARRQSSLNSIPRAAYDRRLIRYENTYRMEPDGDRKVDLVRVRRIATSALESGIAGYHYDATQAKQFSLSLADRMRAQMKQLPFQRYKIVIQVCIGQKKGQDLRVASRCIWDLKVDRHVTIAKETKDAYVTVIIFFIYTE